MYVSLVKNMFILMFLHFSNFFGGHFRGPQAFSMNFEVTRILISSNGLEKSFEMLPGMVWEPSYEQTNFITMNFSSTFSPRKMSLLNFRRNQNFSWVPWGSPFDLSRRRRWLISFTHQKLCFIAISCFRFFSFVSTYLFPRTLTWKCKLFSRMG